MKILNRYIQNNIFYVLPPNTCRAQRDALQAELSTRAAHHLHVALAMRYGNPTIESALNALRTAGCERIVILPCYPQQAKVITGTCLEAVHAALETCAKQGWAPEVLGVKCFWHQPAYQEALATAVAKAWSYQSGAKLIVSCHSTLLSIPRRLSLMRMGLPYPM